MLMVTALCRGHVFVFTGILPICGGEAGVAAVIGHEIAHNVAHHAAERMSQGLLVALATWLINVFVGPSDGWANVLFDYGFMRPGSRKQEVGHHQQGLHAIRILG